MLTGCDALKSGHFVLASGRHTNIRVDTNALHTFPPVLELICGYIGDHFKRYDPHTVIGQDIGGAILAHCVARHLGNMTGCDTFSVYAEKANGGELRIEQAKLIVNRPVLVVADVIITGASTAALIAAVKALGGNLIGLAAVCNFGVEADATLDVPDFFSLMIPETWAEDNCPLCAQGVPVILNAA